MQIPTSFSAAQAVSIASQVSARDKDSALQATTPSESMTVQASLEKSQGASADRDAQGQGDGVGARTRQPRDENDVANGTEPSTELDASSNSNHDDDPPHLIDLLC